jgi:tRNA nucleotidyltransferase (CCA-adding enzyme)
MDDSVSKLKMLFPKPLHDRLFLVGGMVRDILLGIGCQDFDLAAAIPSSELTRLGFRLVESKSTPNIYFFFSKELGKVEVTRLPSLDALDDDLRRRDFTANAMAISFDGVLHDPLGGRKDLADLVLRTCSATSLSDDPARIFRALRFECDGWRLDPEAEGIVSGRCWSDDLRALPVERFSQEMLKALAKGNPGRFFSRMLELRVGQELLPEIFRMPQVPAGPPQHHPEGDLFTHSLQVLERMALSTPDSKARFCALFHDLGKLATPQDQYPKHHGHDAAGSLAAESFCKRLRLPLALQRALQATTRLHTTANRWEELRDSTKIKLAQSAMKGGIADFLPLMVAADGSGTMPGWEQTLRVASLNAAQLGIDTTLFDQGDPEKCRQLILQRQIAELKKISTPS